MADNMYPGANETPASIPRAGIEYVDDFRETVFRVYLDHLLGVIFSTHLHVFRDLGEYHNKVGPLRADVPVAGLGEDEDHALVVLMPTPSYDSETLQLSWTSPEVRVQLPISNETRVLELPQACTLGSGMGRGGKPLTLFCRPQLLEQWKEIYRSSVRTYALLWIAGPHGTGKSCAALAFAYALRPSQWDVIWLHISRMSRLVSCVWLQGDEKITCTLDAVTMESQLSALLRSTSSDKKTVVFVDGYDNSASHAVTQGEIVCDICIEWRLRDVIRHRLVCVTSMSDLSKDFRRELTHKIPATVALSQERQHGMQMTASAANSGEEGDGSDVDDMMFELDEMDVYNEMKFDTVSWSFEDYRQAVQDELFFSTVRSVFPPYHESEDENEKAAKINELLERKYCVAGGNVRLMFDVSVDFAQDSLDDVISSVGVRGVASRLLAKYHKVSGCRGWYYNCLVSAYVARKLAVSHGFAMLERIASRCNVNTMNEWLFEGWFLSKLSRQGIEYVEEGLDQLQGQWGRSDVLFFDPTKATIGMRLDRPMWITPVQWNQGGYDAVFVDKPNALVRYVQVTRANHHSYDHRYFVELLDKLAAHDDLTDVQLKKVQLYFVVPREKLSVFRRPVQSADFQENVIQGPFSSLASAAAAARSLVYFVLQNCKAEVKTLGVDYEGSIY